MNLIFKEKKDCKAIWTSLMFSFLIVVSLDCYALPSSFEIWFISPIQTSSLQQATQRYIAQGESVYSDLLAEADYMKDARPMGDGYFFHPQVGLFRKDNKNKKIKMKEGEGRPKGGKYFSATGTDMVNCDKSHAFDLFCGKAKKVRGKSVSLEVWVDVSSSLRAVDYPDKSGHCMRRSFVERLKNSCKDGSMQVSSFDTSIKTIGSTSSLCDYYGLNDQDRLIRWIKASTAKKIIIITDIMEYTTKLSDFAAKNGGKFVGEVKPLVAKDLLSKVSAVSKHCK